ncbi:unnamed protein product, partial [Mesorhabditis belari]|uniref:Pebble n=1 Tax=Mesorhabditis belari TaxID=2138241 RepID=A0AAF3FK79_9BILA
MDSNPPIISLGFGLIDRRYKALAREAGLKVKKFSPKTDILVSTSVLDENYRVSVSLGIPIVRPVFLEYAASFEENFQLTPDLISKSKLPRFAGARVFFALFTEEEMASKRNLIETYGGSICQSSTDATHVIVPFGEEYPADSQHYVVTDQWITESLNLGWCANEKLFFVTSRQGKLMRRDALRRGQCESGKKTHTSFRKLTQWRTNRADSIKYKRYTQTGELYKNEMETLRKLDALIRIKNLNIYLSPAQSDIVFGNLEALHAVHSRIVDRLAKVFSTWADDSVIGIIFIEESEALEAAYAPYLFRVQYSLESLKAFTQRNPKFKAYIQGCENDRMLGRHKVSDLITAPYQELTNKINVLLKEILKNTPENMPDFASLRQAVFCITEILSRVNEMKRVNAEVEAIYRQIENIPARIVASMRRLQHRCDIESVGGTGEWSRFSRTCLHLIMFDDLLMICQPHQKAISCVNLSNQDAVLSSCKYRQEESVDLSCFRGVLRVLAEGCDTTYIFTIRTEVSDDEWAIRGESLETLIGKLAVEINNASDDRFFTSETIKYTEVDEERKAHLRKLVAAPSFSSSINNENSPIVKLRTYSKRLTSRKRREKSLQRLPEPVLQKAPCLARPKSEYGLRNSMPDLIPLQESSRSLSSSVQLAPIIRDNAMLY